MVIGITSERKAVKLLDIHFQAPRVKHPLEETGR